MFLSVILSGSITAVGVLSQLHSGIIPLGVQYALLCSIPHCCFLDFLGQICTFPFSETVGTCLIKRSGLFLVVYDYGSLRWVDFSILFWYRIPLCSITRYTSLRICVTVLKISTASALIALVLVYLQLGRNTVNIR